LCGRRQIDKFITGIFDDAISCPSNDIWHAATLKVQWEAKAIIGYGRKAIMDAIVTAEEHPDL
jgi:hypothetical protein